MTENYVDFSTFLSENVFIGNIVTSNSNLNVHANEFIPRSSSSRNEEVTSYNKGNNNYEGRKSKPNHNGTRKYNNYNRNDKRNDFWNKNREVNNHSHDSTKVINILFYIWFTEQCTKNSFIFFFKLPYF